MVSLAPSPAASDDPSLPVLVQKMGHWFGLGEAKKQVLYDVDLSLQPGQLTILEGVSGSGKTTLLTLIGCLRQLQVGRIRLLGTELLGAEETTLVACRRKLGFIFQAHNLHESLTATQNVMMGLAVQQHGLVGNGDAAVNHLLTILGLGDRLNYLPANLSGGQKQRAAIARALIADPLLVLADEPTAALDKDSALQIVRMLKALGKDRQTTTLMVTHDSKVLDLADRIVTMEEGRIVKDSAA
jgi:putative ABC transport system ATP-binding protein